MAKNFIQSSGVIDYTATADVASGDVVRVGMLLGVALTNIANGKTGPVQIRGVFRVPKTTAAVIAQGESLVWKSSTKKFSDKAAATAAGDVTGATAVAWEAAGSGATDIAVLFTTAPGVVA